MTLIEAIRQLVEGGKLPRIWQTRHLLERPELLKDFKPVTLTTMPPNYSRSPCGASEGHNALPVAPFFRFKPENLKTPGMWFCLRENYSEEDPRTFHAPLILNQEVDKSLVSDKVMPLQRPNPKTMRLWNPPKPHVTSSVPSEQREVAIAELLSRWYRDTYPRTLDAEGRYQGWASSFGYMVDDQTFGLDLKDPEQWWPLMILAVCWSYNGQWENASAFIGILARLKMLGTSAWQGLDTPSKVLPQLERARQELEIQLAERGKKAKFPFEWVPETAPLTRKRVFFPKSWAWGLSKAVELWPTLEALFLAVRYDNLEGDDFLLKLWSEPVFQGLAGHQANPHRRMRVKVPMLLRELRAAGVVTVPAEFCNVADQRVRLMRTTLGLPNATSQDPAAWLMETRRIGRAYGDLYDMPLFAFWEFCSANPNGHGAGCFRCPVRTHCPSACRDGSES